MSRAPPGSQDLALECGDSLCSPWGLAGGQAKLGSRGQLLGGLLLLAQFSEFSATSWQELVSSWQSWPSGASPE